MAGSCARVCLCGQGCGAERGVSVQVAQARLSQAPPQAPAGQVEGLSRLSLPPGMLGGGSHSQGLDQGQPAWRSVYRASFRHLAQRGKLGLEDRLIALGKSLGCLVGGRSGRRKRKEVVCSELSARPRQSVCPTQENSSGSGPSSLWGMQDGGEPGGPQRRVPWEELNIQGFSPTCSALVFPTVT